MKVGGAWLDDPRTQSICRVLTDAGHQALFVGGCVRNALLDEPVADVDISTDAHPDRVMQLAVVAGMKAIPTGIDHGTVTIVAEGEPHEITTFRRDVETDGRRAVVAFTDRIEEDALRRDLTINALYARADGTVVDPLGGLPDLVARRIRFIENAEDRIREDYLRILRFFRFHAWYGDPDGGLDPAGLAACSTLAAGLETLSKERIGTEMLKLLSAPDPGRAMTAFRDTGGLARILPGSDVAPLHALLDVERGFGLAPDAIRRLAALGGRDPGDDLRMSRRDARRYGQIRAAAVESMAPPELGYRHGRDLARDALAVRAAVTDQNVARADFVEIETGADAKFPVRAADLGADYRGAAIGERLRALEAQWIAEGFRPTREDLLSR